MDFKLDSSWDHWGRRSPYGIGRNPVVCFLQNPSSCIAHLRLLVALNTKWPCLAKQAFQQDPGRELARSLATIQVVPAV